MPGWKQQHYIFMTKLERYSVILNLRYGNEAVLYEVGRKVPGCGKLEGCKSSEAEGGGKGKGGYNPAMD